MPVDFTKLPIGTKVETMWGPGKIVRVDRRDPLFKVEVSIGENNVVMYTADGKYFEEHAHPTLFLSPFEWPTQEQPEPPLPDLPVDAPIMVRDKEHMIWHRRHFAQWKGGKAMTFKAGGTSFTDNRTIAWQQWRLPTEEELKGPNDVE